jgi:hypothetical protein
MVTDGGTELFGLVNDEFVRQATLHFDLAVAHEHGGSEVHEVAQWQMADDHDDGAEAVAFDLAVSVKQQVVVEMRLFGEWFAAHEAATKVRAWHFHRVLHFVTRIRVGFNVHELTRLAPGQRWHDKTACLLGGSPGEFVRDNGVEAERVCGPCHSSVPTGSHASSVFRRAAMMSRGKSSS